MLECEVGGLLNLKINIQIPMVQIELIVESLMDILKNSKARFNTKKFSIQFKKL